MQKISVFTRISIRPQEKCLMIHNSVQKDSPLSGILVYLVLTISTLFCACLVTQSCLTLCDPMDCSLPGSSIHGFLQARILEWVAIPFSRGSS